MKSSADTAMMVAAIVLAVGFVVGLAWPDPQFKVLAALPRNAQAK